MLRYQVLSCRGKLLLTWKPNGGGKDRVLPEATNSWGQEGGAAGLELGGVGK